MSLGVGKVGRLTGSVLLGILGAAWMAAAQAGRTAVDTLTPTRILREIRDPATGARWQILRNTANPAGPGRVVLADDCGRQPCEFTPTVPLHAAVIRPGDHVALEEHTATADASLEAIALDRAAIGSPFKVRLKIGGKVVRAVAIAPGRAALLPPMPPGAEALP